MTVTRLESAQNPLVKAWRAGKGLFLAEGERMADEALKTGFANTLVCDAALEDKFSHLTTRTDACYLVPARVLASLCEAKTPQGVLAVCKSPKSAPLSALGARVVALDGVQDPGNVGTILRTLDAAGFTGLLTDEKTASAFSPKALRASMGGCFRVPVCRAADFPGALSALAHDHALIAADVHGEPAGAHDGVPASICLVVGSEGAGVSEAALSLCERRVALPMPGGAESLNVAVAAGIFIYDILRGRL